MGDDNARQPYCHTNSCSFFVPPRGKCCPFFSFCVFSVSGPVSFVGFLSFLLSKGRFLEKFSGANFCFWVVVLVLGFLGGFCYCFCFIFWRFAPETVRKKFSCCQVWCFSRGRSLFLWFFWPSSSFSVFVFVFSFFKRHSSGSHRTPPHTRLFFWFFFFLCPAAFVFSARFGPCVPLLGVFPGCHSGPRAVLGFSLN